VTLRRFGKVSAFSLLGPKTVNQPTSKDSYADKTEIAEIPANGMWMRPAYRATCWKPSVAQINEDETKVISSSNRHRKEDAADRAMNVCPTGSIGTTAVTNLDGIVKVSLSS